MAHTASRTTKGFEHVGYLIPGMVDPGIKEFEMTPSLAVVKGDMLVLGSAVNKVALATSSSTQNILGVAAESKTADDTDVTKIQVYTNPFNVYRCSFTGHADNVVDSATTTTIVDAELTMSADDDCNGAYLYIYEGTNKGAVRTVSDFDESDDTITFTDPLPEACDTTSKYILLGECDDAGTSVINVGTIGVQLVDEDTIDSNAATDAEDGPLGVVAINGAELTMDVFIRKPLFGTR